MPALMRVSSQTFAGERLRYVKRMPNIQPDAKPRHRCLTSPAVGADTRQVRPPNLHTTERKLAGTQPSVQNAEERDGSRGLYSDKVLKLDSEFETAGSGLIAASHEFAATGVQNARSAASAGTRLITIITLVPLLAAVRNRRIGLTADGLHQRRSRPRRR
jgi:hypothetical protein